MKTTLIQWMAGRAGFMPDHAPIRAMLTDRGTAESAWAAPPGVFLPAGSVLCQLALADASEPPDGEGWAAAVDDWLSEFAPVRRCPDAPAAVYREVDEAGLPVRDVIRTIDDEPLIGMPLLLKVWRDGAWIGRPASEADIARIRGQQEKMLEVLGERAITVVDETHPI